MSDSLQPYRMQQTRLLCPWDFLGKNTGVGCQALLQGILLDPGIEPAFPVAPALQADSFTTEPRKPLFIINKHFKLLLQEHWSQYLVYYTVRKGSHIAISLLHLFCFSWNSYYSHVTLILFLMISISLYSLSGF